MAHEITAQPSARMAWHRPVQDEEVEAVIAAAESRDLAPIIEVVMATAIRSTDLCCLRWVDVDLRARTAKLRQGSKVRTLALPPATVEVLQSLLRQSTAVALLQGLPPKLADAPVFRTPPHAVGQAFREAVERARGRYVADCKARGEQPDPKFLAGLQFSDLRKAAYARQAATSREVSPCI